MSDAYRPVVAFGTNALTTTPEPLATNTTCSEVIVQADPTNAANVKIGDSASQPMFLIPGASLTLTVRNLNAIYVAMASGTGNVNFAYAR